MQQPSNFLTDEYYNPRKLRLTKIKINEIFTTKIFHNMKKLYKILFLGGRGAAIFRGGGGGNFPEGLISGRHFSGVIFPSTILRHYCSVSYRYSVSKMRISTGNVFYISSQKIFLRFKTKRVIWLK